MKFVIISITGLVILGFFLIKDLIIVPAIALTAWVLILFAYDILIAKDIEPVEDDSLGY